MLTSSFVIPLCTTRGDSQIAVRSFSLEPYMIDRNQTESRGTLPPVVQLFS